MSNDVIKTVAGIDIKLGNDGKFFAVKNNKVVQKGSLASLEKELLKAPSGKLPVGLWRSYSRTYESAVVTGTRRLSEKYGPGWRLLDAKGEPMGGSQSAYITTPEAVAETKALDEEMNQLSEEYRRKERAIKERLDEIRRQLIEVTPDNFAQLLEEYGEKAAE